jgi:hypothetical protein
MARPSNSEALTRYQKKIAITKRWRREEEYDDTWRRLIDLYRGRHYEDISDEDRLLINISFSTINVIAPSVAVNYPKIAVNARRPTDAPKAIITEAVINYWWKHYKVRPEFRRAVKDFLIVGHGWLKCGYRYVEEESISEEGDQSDANVEGNEVTPSIVIVEDRPFVERVSPFDVYVDPDATSMQDALWIAHRIRRSLKDIKSDKRYSRAARENINATSWGRYSEDPAKRKVQDTEEGYVEVWEYYDIAKKTMCVFAEGSEQFLVKPIDMPYAFGHPFVMIRNYDIPDYFYPMGDLEAIEPLQRELNATRTQMMNHRKRYSRKYLFKESAFDADGRDALESDYDNVLVPVSGDENLNNVVVPFPAVVTPPEFYRQSDIIEGDIQTVSGVSEYQRGGVPEIRRTATEAAIVQDAANARAADKLATIEGAIAEVAFRLVALAQQFMTGEQVARVVGKDGEPTWVTFEPDYIAGEFDFDVEAGSTAPVNESFRRQMALQMVDAMSPFAGAGLINMPALAAHVLQFGFGIKNPDQFIQQAPPPPEMGEGMPPEMGMPPQGGMPMPPDMGGMTSQGAPSAGPVPVAPPPSSPDALSGVDPSVLAMLSSRMGVQLPNTM